jgi:hypothetical protein
MNIKKVMLTVLIIVGFFVLLIGLFRFMYRDQIQKQIDIDKQAIENTQKINAETEKLNLVNTCLMDVLQEKTAYENAHPNLTEKDKSYLQDLVEKGTEKCEQMK